MAVPSLAAMAALTLFHNPHMQPEGVSVDYTPYAAPATVIQRAFLIGHRVSGPILNPKRRNLLRRAATRINALMRAFSVRAFVTGLPGLMPGLMDSVWADTRSRLVGPRAMRDGRRYLGQRRRAFQLGPDNPNLVLFQVGQ